MNIKESMIGKFLCSRNMRVLKRAFVFSAMAFFAYYGYESAELYKKLIADIDLQWLLLVILTLMTQSIIAALFTFTLVASTDNSLIFRDVLWVHISRLPARYLPGGIWHVASKLYDFHGKGVGSQGLTRIALFEIIMPISVTFLLGGVAIFTSSQVPDLWVNIALLASVTSFLFVTTYSMVGRFKPIRKYLIPKKSFYQAFIVVSVYWSLAGFGFCFYLASLYEQLRGVGMLDAWGVYLFSWGLGNLAIISPQGVGVLEWAAGSMLPITANLGSMMVVVAGYRVMILISDALCYVAYCLLRALGFVSDTKNKCSEV